MTNNVGAEMVAAVFGNRMFKGSQVYDDRSGQTPVQVRGDSVVFRPSEMELNKYYCTELKGKPYLYRKVGEGEVEVYGLAD